MKTMNFTTFYFIITTQLFFHFVIKMNKQYCLQQFCYKKSTITNKLTFTDINSIAPRQLNTAQRATMFVKLM